MTLILSGTDGVSDVDGSAATPAVRGADANTGIFFPAADTIAFAEGGAEVARITNTGAWSFGATGTATGTNGQVLTSAGSGAAPAWATPSAGALTFISVTTVSSSVAQVDITSGFSSTYDDYLIVLENVVGPLKLAMRVQKSGSFQTTGYNLSRTLGQAGGPTYSGSINNSRWTFLSANGMANTNRMYGTVYLLNVNDTTGRTGCSAQVGNISSTNSSGCQASFTGEQTTAAALTGVRFLDEDAENITAGTFRLYGIQKS